MKEIEYIVEGEPLPKGARFVGVKMSKEEFHNEDYRDNIEERVVTNWYPDENGIARPVTHVEHYYGSRRVFLEKD